MCRMNLTHVAIINLWDSVAELATDIGAKPSSVRKWKQRGKVPSAHWPAMVRAARDRKKKLTIEMLAEAQSAPNSKVAA
jgi:uncharacterized protein YjcR